MCRNTQKSGHESVFQLVDCDMEELEVQIGELLNEATFFLLKMLDWKNNVDYSEIDIEVYKTINLGE